MNKKKTTDPIYGFENIRAPIEAEDIIQESGQSRWESGKLLIGVALFMAVLDGSLLFDMMDLVLVQNAYLGAFVAVGIALVLNLTPLTIAKFVNESRYRLDADASRFALIATAIFAVFYIAVVILRFNCLELYTSSVSKGLVNTAATESSVSTTTDEAQRRAVMTALFLSIEPLATSGVSFVLAILTDNPVKKKIKALERRIAEISVGRAHVSTALASMWEDKDFLLNSDMELLIAARDRVEADAERLKAEGRMMLADKLGDPDSISALSRQRVEDAQYQASSPELLTYKSIEENIA